MKFVYSAAQLRFIERECKKFGIPELARRFNARFGMCKSETAIRACLKNHGIRSGRPMGNPVGTLLLFTKEQAAFVRRAYRKLTLEEVAEALNAKFSTNFTPMQIRSFTRNHKVLSGRTGCFEKGLIPWNYGTKGMGFTGRNRTTFKKGNRPHNTKWVGHERIDSEGYTYVSVPERNPHTGYPRRYRLKHNVIWEKTNGPLPKGCAIIFRDGDKRNFRDKNLACVTRAELLNLNRNEYSKASPQIKPSVFAVSKLEVRMRELSRKRGACANP